MILWGKEHEARAVALAHAYGEKAMNLAQLPQSTNGIQPVSCEDVTLSVWGHGGPTSFCDLVDVEFAVMIENWKKQNHLLKTAEIITCDARHHLDYLAGYATRVAKYLDDQNAKVEVRALPVGQHRSDKSILWANPGTSTFCYLTSPDEKNFVYANAKMKQLEAKAGNDLSVVSDEMSRERTNDNGHIYSVNGGRFDHLRNVLGAVA